MAIFKDTFKGPLPGILVGVAATLAAPIILAALAASARPVVKAAIKGYLGIAERVKEMIDETREQMSDIVAEARSEHSGDTDSKPPRPKLEERITPAS